MSLSMTGAGSTADGDAVMRGVLRGDAAPRDGAARAGRVHELLNDLPGGLHEIRCAQTRAVGAAAGLLVGVLAARGGGGRIVWITDPAARSDAGGLYPQGLAMSGLDPARLILVTPMHLGDALWAADQAAACGDLAAVVLHVSGNPSRLGLTATRRLLLRARGSRVRVFILRQGGEGAPSAAVTRWAVCPAPSPGDGLGGIGPPVVAARLERNRGGRTGDARALWDNAQRVFTHVLEFDQAGAPAHPKNSRVASALPADGPDSPAQMGQVMALEGAT